MEDQLPGKSGNRIELTWLAILVPANTRFFGTPAVPCRRFGTASTSWGWHDKFRATFKIALRIYYRIDVELHSPEQIMIDLKVSNDTLDN